MGDLIELSKYRPQHPSDDAVDESVVEELRRDANNEAWMRDLMIQIEQGDVGEDMLYVCLNRSLVEHIMRLVDEVESVLSAERMSAPSAQSSASADYGSLSELVEEFRQSTHVLWLSLPDHYAILTREIRQRVNRYNRLLATFSASH